MRDRLTLTARGGVDGWAKAADGAAVTVWAQLESIKQKDKTIPHGVQTEATIKATIRYRREVDSTFTATENGNRYAIIGMEMDAKRTFLVLYLKRIA